MGVSPAKLVRLLSLLKSFGEPVDAQVELLVAALEHVATEGAEMILPSSVRCCDVCRRPIVDGRTDRKTCSKACRQKLYRSKKSAA